MISSSSRKTKPTKQGRPSTAKLSNLSTYGPLTIRSLAASRPPGPEIKWYDSSGENRALYHNASGGADTGIYTLTTFPSQGTSVNTRIGDRVFVKQIDVKLWLSNKSDRPNVMYRVLCAILPGVTGTSSLSVASILAGPNTVLSYPQCDKVSIIYDTIVNPDMFTNTIIPSSATGKERSYYHKFTLPINEAMSINSNNVCDTSNIAVYVITYDAYGTLTSDNIASCSYNTRLWFTDA